MKEPPRLMDQGSPLHRELLAAGADEQVPAEVSARMAAALGLTGTSLAPPAALATKSASSAASQASSSVLLKFAAGAAIAGAVGVTLYALSPSDSPVVPPPAPTSNAAASPAAASPAATVEAQETEAQDIETQDTARNIGEPGQPHAPEASNEPPLAIEDEPGGRNDVEESLEATRGGAPAKKAASTPQRARSAGDVAAEVRLLDSARAAITTGKLRRAHTLLDSYERRFPRGVLKREATVLRQAANESVRK